MTIKNLIAELEKDIELVTEEEIKQFYDDYKDGHFTEPAQRKVRHILVERKSDAEIILSRLENGEEFAELAERFSNCPSGSNGGNLGFVKKENLDRNFASAAFNLEVGKLTQQPVSSSHGWHVIEVLDKKSGNCQRIR